MNIKNIELSIVVPVYNEEVNIIPFYNKIKSIITPLDINFEIIFSCDPCTDLTEDVIKSLAQIDVRVKLIKYTRRFGQPAATLGGIYHCSGNYCVVIDVDLQDPPELIVKMYQKAVFEGFDVVMAQRKNRDGETFIKKIISSVGYRVINKASDISIPPDTGDFRIMSRRVIDELKKLKETHGFLRGLVSFVGFKQTIIQYDRDRRNAGNGKYNRFTGSLKIGLNGLISFSTKPLFIMSLFGFFLSFISFLIGAIYLVMKLTGSVFSEGLPTTVLLITTMSGIQLFSIGLLGEYVGRIYDEVKLRPMYIVDELVNFDESK